MCFDPSPERRVPSPNRYMAFARFCFCKNNKRTIDRSNAGVALRQLTMHISVNRVRTDMVRIGPSNLLSGQSGLFACENIIEGRVVSSFGAVRAMSKGGPPTCNDHR